MEVGDYLGLMGELAIGVAGFSGIVAALTRRSEGDWRDIDVLRLQMLLRQSIAVAMWAVIPALLLSSGLEGPVLWRVVSGCWLATAPVAFVPVLRRARAQLAEKPEDVSPVLAVFAFGTPVAGIALQGANVILFAAAWPHLATLALGLLLSAVLFLRLATVAFAATRPTR